jgi:hypothetical protein
VTKRPDLASPDLLGAVRACYGGLLLCAPRRMITLAAGHPANPRAAAVARLLGARHLLQAALTAGALAQAVPAAGLRPEAVPADGLWPGTVLLAGSAIDTVHAASMVGLAAACRPLRRAVLADALLEASLVAAGIMTARHLSR